MLNIGFIVDHPRRDLGGALMVAHALSRRGVRTSLIPLYDQAVDVPLLGLDALIVNYARPANFDLVQGYHDMGLPVFVLDTEGGVLAENGANSPLSLAAYVRDSGYAELLAGYLFWGPVLHRAFVEGSGLPAERLHLTGCPRFDFASPRWETTLDYSRSGYVLVNANFPLVNPLFARSPEAESAALVKAGWQPEYVGRLLADQRQILHGYLETIGALARALPQHIFLLRPHPFENPSLYRKACAGQRNIIIDGRGSVLNVIHHAACVLHLNCGTAVEATMLRRLPISMDFLNTEHMAGHAQLPSQVSWRAESPEALEAALADLPQATAGFDFAQRYLDYVHPWFYTNDGGAGERVADAVLSGLSPGRRPDARQALARSLASSRRYSRPGQRLQAGLANLAGSWAASGLRTWPVPARREKRLVAEDVVTLSATLAWHAGSPPPVVRRARHPWTSAPMASITVSPA